MGLGYLRQGPQEPRVQAGRAGSSGVPYSRPLGPKAAADSRGRCIAELCVNQPLHAGAERPNDGLNPT